MKSSEGKKTLRKLDLFVKESTPRWLGHILRMDDALPKQTIYGVEKQTP